jgi:hypothetical protein
VECPVDEPARVWIEQAYERLRTLLGHGVVDGRPFITGEDFRMPFDGSDESGARAFRLVCKFMDVNPDHIRLFVMEDRHDNFYLVNEFDDPVPIANAGEFDAHGDGRSISIGESQLQSPADLIGTIAHELAHYRLNAKDVNHEDLDSELLTDMAVFHLGLGVFIANSPRAWLADASYWPGTDLLMPQYMDSAMCGYALAYAAFRRQEPKPKWSRHLVQDAAENMKAGLKYLSASSRTA